MVSASFAADRAYADVLSGMGFRPIRRFWRMLLDLASSARRRNRPRPAGVGRRTVSGDGDRRALHALFTESFADHFGDTHERGFDEWIASIEALPGTDPGALVDRHPRRHGCRAVHPRRLQGRVRRGIRPHARRGRGRPRARASAGGCWSARQRTPSHAGGPGSRSLSTARTPRGRPRSTSRWASRPGTSSTCGATRCWTDRASRLVRGHAAGRRPPRRRCPRARLPGCCRPAVAAGHARRRRPTAATTGSPAS